MVSSGKRAIRIALALVVGVPVTLIFGTFAGIAVYSGIRNAFSAFVSVAAESSPLAEIGAGVGLALWGFLGVLGFVGFWLWVFSPRLSYRDRIRPVIVSVVSMGVLALISLLIMVGRGALSPLYLTFGILGIISGSYVVYDLANDGSPRKMSGASDVS